MKIRRMHRLLGAVLLLPLLCWSLTGFFFFIKPGYSEAYGPLSLKFYPLDAAQVALDETWQECRLLRTRLGLHLLVKTSDGQTLHLDPETGAERPLPEAAQLQQLIEDSIAQNKARYGAIEQIRDHVITTDQGVKITLNWKNLTLYQYGEDTAWIDRVYSLHYLQWTGQKQIDAVIGSLGLVLLILMSGTGCVLLVKG